MDVVDQPQVICVRQAVTDYFRFFPVIRAESSLGMT
jgi:hypothetical protein